MGGQRSVHPACVATSMISESLFIIDRSSPRAGGQKQSYSKEKVNPLENPELQKHQQFYLTSGDNHIQGMNNNISDKKMGIQSPLKVKENKLKPMHSSYCRGDCWYSEYYFQSGTVNWLVCN